MLHEWDLAWKKYDLDKVMVFFHTDAFFENWNGAYVKGAESIRKAWKNWFDNHGRFRFIEEEIFIDETVQKVLYRWILEWPSAEPGYEGQMEIRKGVDILHLHDGKIINKLTYTKTNVEIDGRRLALHL